MRVTLEQVKLIKINQKEDAIVSLESEIARLKAETMELQRQLGMRNSEKKSFIDLNKTIEALNIQLGSVTESEVAHKQKITNLLDEKHRLEEQLHTFRTRSITLESENKILVSKGVSEGDSKRWISLLEAKTQEYQELRLEIQRYIAIMGEKDSIIRDLQHNIEVLKKDLELNSSSIHLRNSKLGRASRGASPVLTDRGKGTSGIKIEIETSSHKFGGSARGPDTSHYERTIQDLR
jgi:chromosome segregation ATPase